MPKKLKITETVLRDANQSLCATRLPMSEFKPILETMNKVGYHSVECWGGATFDSCLRYLNEDPWERLRTIRKAMPDTKLQMLLRGQNILGYKHYSDDTVRAFVRKSVENGIDIIRIFDALNDMRNIETAVDECLKAGGEAQGTISYTQSPVHTLENYAKLGKQIEELGCQSLCIKDMAGVMSPQEVYDLITALKAEVKIPIVVHTHATTGLGSMTYLKAVEAGADVIDCAISPFAGGTSQPCTEAMDHVLVQMGYETGLDRAAMRKVNEFFEPIKKEYVKEGKINPFVMNVNTNALHYKIPGGMLSNLIANLTDMKALDRLDEVLAEVPNVRKDMGYPPLVTPLSQMVGSQAVNNVLMGERYKNITKEIRAYIRGEYGKAPAEINPELVTKVLGEGNKPMEGRYAETLKPEIPEAVKKLEGIAESEEDVLSYVAFPQQAEKFFQYREEHKGVKVTYSIKKVD